MCDFASVGVFLVDAIKINSHLNDDDQLLEIVHKESLLECGAEFTYSKTGPTHYYSPPQATIDNPSISNFLTKF